MDLDFYVRVRTCKKRVTGKLALSNLIDIMQCHVTHCVICISNNVKYFDKEEYYKNSKLYCEFKCSLQCNQENTGTFLSGTLTNSYQSVFTSATPEFYRVS